MRGRRGPVIIPQHSPSVHAGPACDFANIHLNGYLGSISERAGEFEFKGNVEILFEFKGNVEILS